LAWISHLHVGADRWENRNGFGFDDSSKRRHNMSDNKSQVGKADRDRVSASEDYEVNDLAQKFGITAAQARDAIKSAGPMRRDVEAHLRRVTTA
jgi:hypothetical protein